MVWRVCRIRFEQPINYDLVCELNFAELDTKNEEHQEKLFITSQRNLGLIPIEDYDAVALSPVQGSGYLASGSAGEWGNPWAAFSDISGSMGTCSPKSWKLAASQTSVKVLASAYVATDAAFTANATLKDRITTTTDDADSRCD